MNQFETALREVFPELSEYEEDYARKRVTFVVMYDEVSYADLRRVANILGTDDVLVRGFADYDVIGRRIVAADVAFSTVMVVKLCLRCVQKVPAAEHDERVSLLFECGICGVDGPGRWVFVDELPEDYRPHVKGAREWRPVR